VRELSRGKVRKSGGVESRHADTSSISVLPFDAAALWKSWSSDQPAHQFPAAIKLTALPVAGAMQPDGYRVTTVPRETSGFVRDEILAIVRRNLTGWDYLRSEAKTRMATGIQSDVKQKAARQPGERQPS